MVLKMPSSLRAADCGVSTLIGVAKYLKPANFPGSLVNARNIQSGTGAKTFSCSTSSPHAGHQTMNPPCPRVSICGCSFPAVQRNSPCGWNSKCLPPLRVTWARVSGRLARAYQTCASTCCKSASMTTNFSPVGTPISASGQCVHQLSITSKSTLASLKPRSVRGDLLAAQGKHGPSHASFRRGVEAARRTGSLAFERKLSILADETAANAFLERS